MELSRVNDAIDTKKVENARLRVDLAAQREQNDQLGHQKRRTIEDLGRERDRNGADSSEISSLVATAETRQRECMDLQQNIKVLEYDL